MAAGRVETADIDGAGNIELGQAVSGTVSSWLIQLYDDASYSGTLTVQGKAQGADSSDYTAIAYKDMSDGAVKTAGLTTNAIVLVDASGMEVRLSHSYTSGSIQMRAIPLVG